MARLAARDEATERHFVSYFAPLLLAKLRMRLRSSEAVEDARQETFLRVLTNIRREGGLNDPQRLGAYVHAICNNVLMETYRKQKRHGTSDDEVPEQADYRPNPESEFVTKERCALVHSILTDMQPKDRELLQAVFLQDRDKEEICQEMNVNGDYLRVLLHRARGRFKSLLLKKSAAAN